MMIFLAMSQTIMIMSIKSGIVTGLSIPLVGSQLMVPSLWLIQITSRLAYFVGHLTSKLTLSYFVNVTAQAHILRTIKHLLHSTFYWNNQISFYIKLLLQLWIRFTVIILVLKHLQFLFQLSKQILAHQNGSNNSLVFRLTHYKFILAVKIK